jgi:G3E family GTPase
MIDVIIVAGYLGAGKTTFIRKLLKEAFPKNRVVQFRTISAISASAAYLQSM